MMSKEKSKQQKQIVLQLIRDFCAKKLNDDYFQLGEKLTEKLGRKRSYPLASGKPEIWAAAIMHALGSINFMFDRSSEPHLSVSELNEFFGTKQATVTNKSKTIRQMFKLSYWDSDFSLQAVAAQNPLNNLVMVDDLMVPLDSLPEEYQAMVREVRAEGRDITFRTQ
ncbi:MAG: DUF6398 domain-containing protein [Bacteroidota bacterium]